MIRTGDVATTLRVHQGYSEFKMERTASGRLHLASDAIQKPGHNVDISWLPLAAEQYLISADINDYIICDVPIVSCDIPNRNMDSFGIDEVSRFDPDAGRAVYQTFVGKPAHVDHINKDPRKAKGVIFDASLVKVPGTASRYDIRILKGFDRTKDRYLTEEIASGRRNGHSMGAMVAYTRCSYPTCVATSTDGKLNCSHFEGKVGKGRIINGYLIYEKCYGVNYIESSSVSDQANWFAEQTLVK